MPHPMAFPLDDSGARPSKERLLISRCVPLHHAQPAPAPAGNTVMEIGLRPPRDAIGTDLPQAVQAQAETPVGCQRAGWAQVVMHYLT